MNAPQMKAPKRESLKYKKIPPIAQSVEKIGALKSPKKCSK